MGLGLDGGLLAAGVMQPIYRIPVYNPIPQNGTKQPGGATQEQRNPSPGVSQPTPSTERSVSDAMGDMQSKAKTLFKSILGDKYVEPKNHFEYCKLAQEARAELKNPAQRMAFENNVESIGARFGINFGLSRTVPGNPTKVALNEVAFKGLDAQPAAKEANSRLLKEYEAAKKAASTTESEAKPNADTSNPATVSPNERNSTTTTQNSSSADVATIKAKLESLATDGKLKIDAIIKNPNLNDAEKASFKILFGNDIELTVDDAARRVIEMSNKSNVSQTTEVSTQTANTPQPNTDEASKNTSAVTANPYNIGDQRIALPRERIYVHAKPFDVNDNDMIEVDEMNKMGFPEEARLRLVEIFKANKNEPMRISDFMNLVAESLKEYDANNKLPQKQNT